MTETTPTAAEFDWLKPAIAILTDHKQQWLQTSTGDRIHYLRQCCDGVNTVAAEWVTAACSAKGLDPTTPLAGEEWLVGPITALSGLQQLIQTLRVGGQPQPPNLYSRFDGQVVAGVLPSNLFERLLWWGFKGEVWLEPGKPATQGLVYCHQPDQGRVALVLGAGNISAIAILDALYKLFAEDQVVLLKMNPVNGYLGKFFEQAFQSLIAAGFLQIVYGGAEVGQYLCHHPDIDTIHVTGSHHTHDAIVWGRNPTEQARRKAEHQPLTTKPITSELGCVTPILVVPGNWSETEIKFQARHIASMVAHNASFNCAAGQVLVTARDWHLRQAFLQQVQQALAQTPPRNAYYPGARSRYESFLQHYPQARVVGATSTEVPWTFIPDVPARLGEYALQTEAFCGVLAEVSLAATTATEFLSVAVEFADDHIWGNLSCVLLVDRPTQQRNAEELERAIADLKYGAIGVNVWTGVIFSLVGCPWGAYPENDLTDIRSGRGFVHNGYLFEHPQKAVLYAPFHIRPTPLWFADNKNLLEIARRYQTFLTFSNWGNFGRLVAAALRG